MLIRYSIILLAFFFGIIVGKYQVFPYDELRYAKYFITHTYKTIDFKRNVNLFNYFKYDSFYECGIHDHGGKIYFCRK